MTSEPDLPLVLPPETTASQFKSYLTRAREIVNDSNVTVITSDAHPDLTGPNSYLSPAKAHDMYHILPKTHFLASAVVSPRNVPEVQALMRLSTELSIPVWPFSGGRNVGYGGAAPRVPGSVGLDLGRHMNRVLDVNEKSATCLVEPGVTYFDLYAELVRRGLEDKLWVDTPDLGGGSVLGNCVERGVGYTPYGDHFMMHCGMEVVLPSGELIRTGMGAMPHPSSKPGVSPDQQPGNAAWQLFPYGFGPYHDGLFTQSNYGVVTKLGMWLMPNPGGYQPYLFTFAHDADLPAIVDVVRQLRLSSVIQNVPSIRHILLDAAVLGPKTAYSASTAPLTDDELTAIQNKLGLGRWNFYGALYGPEVVRNAQWEVIRAAFSAIPDSKHYWPKSDGTPSPGVLDIRTKTLQGIPTIDELRWVDWVPRGSHLFFSPITEVAGDAAARQYAITRQRVVEAGFDFICTFTVGMREMHHIVCLVFDRESDEERARVHALIKVLIDDCAREGWGEYRTHLALMDQIAGTYSFNGGALNKLNETIKNALDPKGILAPGKNGIWPDTYDKAQWKL
ncbi:hypothetical protein N0V93_001929 [Gnomoniopsis smithogilvyi]|uniref:FAD-binding PCMH-type domain-containing protein n=1 Tax=Gnomoniopsis smithogilvyi TaxID=1191159 RepID=A0A9W8Z4M4_9PEZI|nr:hypothetical protein N0V93_001929 [Gnomoniopsis smithogilvyi]